MLDDLRRDLRYALRQFAAAPTFTLVATLTLALGVGANAAIFSVINGLLLRPLPYPQPEHLLFVNGVLAQPERNIDFQLGYPDVEDIRTEVKTLSAVAAWTTAFGLTLDREDGAQRLAANFVGRDYFTILGGTPLLGRTFTPEDHAIDGNGALVAIVSEAVWRQEFGAESTLIGRNVRMQDRVFTVIGVMPDSFSDLSEGYGQRIDVWAPLERAPGIFGAPDLTDRGNRLMWVVARLADGATLAAAQAELAALGTHIAAAHVATNANFSFNASPQANQYFVEARQPLWLLLGGSLFVLLIGCVNVANLLLVRSADRSREFAVRVAIGASSSRLVRQLCVESLLLAAAGAIGGLLLAAWVTPLLLGLSNIRLPRFSNAPMIWAW